MSAEDTTRQVAALREELRALVDAGTIRVDDPLRRRVTNAELVRGLIDAVTKTGGEHSTIKLTRNAKGDTQIEVSVRTGDSPEVVTAADAVAEAVRLYDNLRELYPMSAEPTRAATSTPKPPDGDGQA